MKRLVSRLIMMLALALPAVAVVHEPVVAQQTGAQQTARRRGFPHQRHQGLFPLCTGCHTGIPTGDSARFLPSPDLCQNCHNGQDQRRVSWTPPERQVPFLRFDHPAHASRAAREGRDVQCASCHVAEGGPTMAVVSLSPDRCFTCHGRDPQSHMTAATNCTMCHRAVATTSVGEGLLGAVPKPADHEARDFLATHGPTSPRDINRCATCHTQEKCASCHVDPSLDAIQAMPEAPADWTLPAMAAHYPRPASHRADDWEQTHGRPVPTAAQCSTCHTRDDCAACHIAPLPEPANSLPPRPEGRAGGQERSQERPQERQQVRAPGVGLRDRLPGSHQSPFFLAAHPTVAAAQPATCSGCHTESYCAACHNAPRAPGYHPPDFAMRHAAAAGSASMECANCHNTQAFCRQCHLEAGFGASGRLGSGYHDAEPVWLLRHGQAARQGLEQCASCHTQKECLQCHSQTGAFKVNPHGPNFDPERARQRNPWICSACHIGFQGGT